MKNESTKEAIRQTFETLCSPLTDFRQFIEQDLEHRLATDATFGPGDIEQLITERLAVYREISDMANGEPATELAFTDGDVTEVQPASELI